MAAAVAALAGASSPVSAQDVGASFTNTLTVELHDDNANGRDDDDGYGAIIDRLNASAAWDDASVVLRVDAESFPSRPSLAWRDQGRLERATARLRAAPVELVVGDFYKQLGRGLALSARKVDEIGFDLALRGVDVSAQGESAGGGAFVGLGNPSNLDAVTRRFQQDTGDLVAGGLVEVYEVGELATVSAFGVVLDARERVLELPVRTWTGGVSADLPAPTQWLTLYVEADVQRRTLLGMSEQGTGAYGALNLLPGDTTILLEGLWLDDFELKGSTNSILQTRVDYNQAPTLERQDQEVLSNRDVRGGRVRVEHLLLDLDLLLHANLMLRVNNVGEPDALRQLHGYTGGELGYQEGLSRLQLSGGYRAEDQQGEVVKTILHEEWNWVQHLHGPLALHLAGDHQQRTLADDAFSRGSTFLGVEAARTGALTWEWGYDTQDQRPGVRNVFHALIVADELDEGWKVSATAGTQRGGIKCVAGVCRDYPGFAGVRAELVGRF